MSRAVILSVLAVAYCIIAVQSQYLRKCKNDSPLPTALRINYCEGDICTFKKSKFVNLEVDFKTTATTKNMTLELVADIEHLDLYNITLMDFNVCTNLTNATCPLTQEESYTFALNIEMPNVTVEKPVNVTFKFLDDDRNVQVCGILSCILV